MRVLHIAKDLAPNSGITTYLRTVLAAQVKRGDTEVHLMSGNGTIPEDLASLSIPYQVRPMAGGVRNVVMLPFHAAAIAAYCRRHRIDIIHTHHRYPELAAVGASRRCGARTVATVHSIVTGMKALSFRSDRLIAVSDAVRRHVMERFGADERRITRVYNPVVPMPPASPGDPERVREELGIPPSHRLALYVGRFDAVKGGPFLARVFRSDALQRTGLSLLMVGDLARDRPLTETMPNGNRLIILPAQGRMHRLYRAADLIILPSRMDPFPYIMLEAGQAGCPFVGSDVDGIAEFIDHGENGLLFPAGNTVRLAECIRTMLDDAEGAARMARALKAKVDGLPDADEHSNALHHVYLAVMTEHGHDADDH